MATSAYMAGRKRYQRPEAILWSENSGTLSGGLYLPNGYEVGADVPTGTSPSLIDQFLILSDHNRGDLSFSPQRIEQRQRTINGRMRSYYIADKTTISVSWNMLPSRPYSEYPDFGTTSGKSPLYNTADEYIVDGGAGGVEMLNWYETHPGPFWMFLAYDKYTNFGTSQYTRLAQYNEIIQVYITDFSYSVVKRGGSNFDFWNVSVTMEEV